MAIKVLAQVTLSFTDLTGKMTGCTTLGSNKFWKGWVEDPGDGTGNFECRWGATGTPGKDTGSKRGVTLSKAVSLFESKRRSKIKKGYTVLDVRDDAEEAVKQAAAGVAPTKVKPLKQPPAHSFHRDVSSLLATIYGSTANSVRRGLSAQAGSTEENPIGNLSDRQLDVGGALLDDVEALLVAEFGQWSPDNKDRTLPLGRDDIPSDQIIDLTNAYMSNVPRSIDRADRGKRNLHRLVISSFDRLAEQRRFLQILRDAHVSKAIFQQAAQQTSTGGKEAIWYDGLNCDIEALGADSADFRRVKAIFETGQSRRNANFYGRGVRMVRVFKFTRTNTEIAYNRYKAVVLAKTGAAGEIHAWHGTRTENLLGIGKSGLLMPENLPRGVRLSGKAFGAGIYHAPVLNNRRELEGYKTDGTNGALKSLNYTSLRGAYYGGANTAKGAYMFLQHVALGRGQVFTRPCWGQHRPTDWPQRDFIYANAGGCSTLAHDELVTFSQDAQAFRYLCEFQV